VESNTVKKHNIVRVYEDDAHEYMDRPEEERELNILSLDNTTEKNITNGKFKLILLILRHLFLAGKVDKYYFQKHYKCVLLLVSLTKDILLKNVGF
jgi:hypothetical protein